MRARLREERCVPELAEREEDEGEEEPEEDVRARGAEDRLRGDLAVVRDPAQGHGKGRAHEEADRNEIGDAEDRRRGHEEHEGRQGDADSYERPVPGLHALAGLRVADRDDQRRGREEDAGHRAPASVRHELDDEEVRQQEDEQARVAVQRSHNGFAFHAHRAYLGARAALPPVRPPGRRRARNRRFRRRRGRRPRPRAGPARRAGRGASAARRRARPPRSGRTARRRG